MTKRKENWVDLLCRFCNKPTGAKVNTLSELGGQFIGTCQECLSGKRTDKIMQRRAEAGAYLRSGGRN